MENNIKNIASHIKAQLPNYISSDNDYSTFVKFLELYYEWLSKSDGTSGVTNSITEYADIDNTLDIFSNLFKNELAASFPNVTKLKSLPRQYSDNIQADQAGESAESAIQTLYDQEFLGDGNTSIYKLNYFNPFYYFGETDATSIVSEVIVYENPDTVGDRGSGTTLQSFVDSLTPPGYDATTGLISTGDYSKLSEASASVAGYILIDNVISFLDSNGNPSNIALDHIIKVRFVIKTYTDAALSPGTTDEYNNLVDSVKIEKTSYENQSQFMKFMKEFYQSKGSEKSYEFLFHALFNEDIEIYYPKNHIFRASNNEWNTTKSVRAEPYVPTSIQPKVTAPYEIVGNISGATAVIEYYKDIKIGTYSVREYFLGSITGTFTSREMVTISQTDNTKYEEKLYDCITGFDIVNGGSNYSQNQPVELSDTYVGSGSGFSANISHTSSGAVDTIKYVNRGDGYITGEELRFNEYGTFGTGAAADILETSYDTENYDITFVQNPTSLDATGEWNLGLGTDSNGNPYTYDLTAKDINVKIENIDILSHNVFGLFDFENVSDVGRMIDKVDFAGEYQDLKNNMTALTNNTTLISNIDPTKQIINLNEGEGTETRYVENLDFSVASVDVNGKILSISYDTPNGNPQGSLTAATVNLSAQEPYLKNNRGFGAAFDLNIADNLLQTISINTVSGGGQLYGIGDKLIIKGEQLPYGVTGTHDIEITVDSVSGGEIVNDIGLNTILDDNPLDGYLTNTVKGTGAIWDVDTTQGTYKNAVAILLDGSSVTIDYKVNEFFIIPGNLFSGGISSINDVGIVITSVDDLGRIDDYRIVGNPIGGEISTFTVTGTLGPSGDIAMPNAFNRIEIYSSDINTSDITPLAPETVKGSNAQFTISKSGAEYQVWPCSDNNRGNNYTVGTTLLVKGSKLDGIDGTNDLVLTVDRVTSTGGILSLSITGSPIAANGFISTNFTETKIGFGATFDISVVNGVYTNSLTIVDGGTDYAVGQPLFFDGSDLVFQWLKDNFKNKSFQTGNNSLATNIGYVRIDDIGKIFEESAIDSSGYTVDFWYFRKSQKLGTGSSSAIWSIDDYITGQSTIGLYQESDGSLTLKNARPGATTSVCTSSILPFGEWHHIAVQIYDAGVELIINGTMVSSSTASDWYAHDEYGLQSEDVTSFVDTADKWTNDSGTGMSTWNPGTSTEDTLDPHKGVDITITRTITRQADDAGGVPQDIPSMTGIIVTQKLKTDEYEISSDGTSVIFKTSLLSNATSINFKYYPRKQNFYIGAHQKLAAEYTIDDFTLGFFGTFRFTKGVRYNEPAGGASGIYQDNGTVNSLSSLGFSPIYVNPIPSSTQIGETSPIKTSFVADGSSASYNLYYDTAINSVDVDVTKTNTDLLGRTTTTTTRLEHTDFTATNGTTIIFSPVLEEGSTVTITTYPPLGNDNIGFLIYDNQYPVVSARNRILLRKLNDSGISSTYTLPNTLSLNVSWNSKPKSPIKTVNLITGGYGYKKFPSANIRNRSRSYNSTGSLGFMIGEGENIGSIKKINIMESSFQTEKNGHGINYIWDEGTPSPTLNLTNQGDGTAVVNVLTGPLCISSGEFLNDEGFVSHDNRIHDGYLWQNYSYVIKVGMYVDEWRKIVKKVIHPSGLMMFGEYTSTSKANVRRGAGIAWTELLYEIIKNVNMKVKNMDGLGQWVYTPTDTYWYPTENRQDTNYLNSQGHKLIYDNRQGFIDSGVTTDGVLAYDGVGTGEISDDTVGAASVDNGSGRYALLTETGTGDSVVDATAWHQVRRIAMNFKDAYGKNYSHFYKKDTIHNTITIYDVSDQELHNNEWIKTRPWGKYKILSSEVFENSNDEYVVFTVSFVAGYREMPTHTGYPNNKVEFRWDNIFRGNVDRSANHWIGSVDNGANPRDGKMIINISGRFNNNIDGDIPTLHTTYRSLERFKFYFRTVYPWQNLSTLFSPAEEIKDSPYTTMRIPTKNNVTMGYLPTLAQNNTWFNMPVELGNTTWTANTDGTDHEWRDTTISEIVTKSDRKYRAVLDSEIKIRPIYLVISEETPDIGLRNRMGPTNLSVERAKFNEKLQSGSDYNDDVLDKNTFEKFISPGTMNDKSNFASEATLVQYTITNIPTSLDDLTEILETATFD
mgnify:CR=1 FL=1